MIRKFLSAFFVILFEAAGALALSHPPFGECGGKTGNLKTEH